jgi:hypothetical protein
LLFAANDAVSLPMLPLVCCRQFDSDASSCLLLLAANDAVSTLPPVCSCLLPTILFQFKTIFYFYAS